MKRAVVLVTLAFAVAAIPSVALADDAPDIFGESSRRFIIGFKVLESLPAVSYSPTDQPQQFATPQQYSLNSEIDVQAAYRVLPWLRAVAVAGFTEISLGWNANCADGAPCMTSLDQDELVIGVGAEAFHRNGPWEVFANTTFRAPIPLVNADPIFANNSGGFDGRVQGGENIALSIGGARRVDTARVFLEVGYLHSVVGLSASAVGLSGSFGGVMFAGGISVW